MIEAHAHLFLDGAPIDPAERENYLKQDPQWMLARARGRWAKILQCGVGAVRARSYDGRVRLTTGRVRRAVRALGPVGVRGASRTGGVVRGVEDPVPVVVDDGLPSRVVVTLLPLHPSSVDLRCSVPPVPLTRATKAADSAKIVGASLSSVATWKLSGRPMRVTSVEETPSRMMGSEASSTTWSSGERK